MRRELHDGIGPTYQQLAALRQRPAHLRLNPVAMQKGADGTQVSSRSERVPQLQARRTLRERRQKIASDTPFHQQARTGQTLLPIVGVDA